MPLPDNPKQVDFNGLFGGVKGAVGDLFSGFGLQSEAKSYRAAAALSDENAMFTDEATKVKVAQEQRKLYSVTSSAEAQIAAGGFEASGSGLDILRDSASQGALQQALVQQQGNITEDSYKEQASSYRRMAHAAGVAATGKFVGAGLNAIGAVLAL